MMNLFPTIPEFATTLLDRLKAAGYEACIVGGAVRNALLHRPVTDWDVATSAPGDEIRRIFSDQKLFALKHETVTLVHADGHFEVTSFKGEKDSLESDLSHRDFTMNAMAVDPEEGTLVDLFGGASDIENRTLRAVGDAKDRFQEDPLRLLRAVRLTAELGFRIQKETLAGMVNTASLLASAAPERIRDELTRILMTARPSASFYLMVRTGILSHFLPELLEGCLKRQNASHRYTIFRHMVETVDQVRPDPVLRLTALLHDIAKPRTRSKKAGVWRFYGHEKESAWLAGEILSRLRFPHAVTKRVTHLIEHHMIGYDAGWGDAAVRRLIRRAGTAHIHDLLTFRRADLRAHGLISQDLALMDELEARVNEQIRLKAPTGRGDLAVNGKRVMEITGLSPGPEVGRLLRLLNERVLDRPELNNREDLTAILKSMQTSS